MKTRKNFVVMVALLFFAVLLIVGCGGGGSSVVAVTPDTNPNAPKIDKADATLAVCATPCPVNVTIKASDKDGNKVYCRVTCGTQGSTPEFLCSEEDVVKGCTFTSAGNANITISARVEPGNLSKTATPVTRAVEVSTASVTPGNNVPVLSNFGVAGGGSAIVNVNDLITLDCAVTDADVADRPTVGCNWKDGNVQTGLSCNALYHSYVATGTFAVGCWADDSKNTSAVQTLTITVNEAPITAPSPPSISTTIPDYVTSNSKYVEGKKGSNCAKLQANNQDIPITANSTSWSYTFNLEEGVNTFNLVCKNSAGVSSTTKVLTINKDTTPPLLPVLNTTTSPTNVATQQLCGNKTLDCNLWLTLRSATAVLIDDDDPHDFTNQNNTTEWCYTVNLISGSNGIVLYCKDDAGLVSGNITDSITYSTGGGGGTATCSLSASPSNPNVNSPTNIGWTTGGTGFTQISLDFGDGSGAFISASSSGSISKTYTTIGNFTAAGTTTSSGGNDTCTTAVNVVSSGGGTATGTYRFETSWGRGGANDIAGFFGAVGDTTYSNVFAVQDMDPSGGCIYDDGNDGNGSAYCNNLYNMPFSWSTPVSIASCVSNGTLGVLDVYQDKVTVINRATLGYKTSFSSVVSDEARIECDNSDGSWLITDPSAGNVRKYDKDGVIAWTYSSGLNTPKASAVDSNGNVYIVDAGNNRVVKLNSSGTFIKVWGSAGQFGSNMRDVTVDKGNKVFVLESNRAQIFDDNGTSLGEFGQEAGSGFLTDAKAIATSGTYGSNSRAFILNGGMVIRFMPR